MMTTASMTLMKVIHWMRPDRAINPEPMTAAMATARRKVLLRMPRMALPKLSRTLAEASSGARAMPQSRATTRILRVAGSFLRTWVKGVSPSGLVLRG